MASGHIPEGILLFLIVLIVLGAKFFRARRAAPFATRGWAGLGIIFLGELLLFLRVKWVTIYFTPLAWTGYLMLADALVASLRGSSRIQESPREFTKLVFWSVPLWLVFEAYNLRLRNWAYFGLPGSVLLQSVGYVWSFGTIWPAIFETTDLIQALRLFPASWGRPIRFSRARHAQIFFAGLLCVTAPVLLPVSVGQYLFGAVWIGFVLLLDPINYRWKGRSLLRDFETGNTAGFFSSLTAGLICGILWEFWNFWAAARWVYIFPIGQRSKIFEMPLVGYFGFPPFALECLVMYEFVLNFLHLIVKWAHPSEWRMTPSRP